jgi:hypothetical protein
VGAHAVDGREDLTFLKGHGQFAVADGPLDLEVDQTIERDRGRYLALDERIDVADVAHHDGNEAQRVARIAPCESGWDADLLAVANAWLAVF